MILSIGFQAHLFITAVMAGIISGAAYDVIRIFRRIAAHSIQAVNAEDILYWVLASAAVFVVFLRENSGEIRPFMIMGVFLGLIIYFLAVSPLVIACAIYIKNIVVAVIKILLRILEYLLLLFMPLLKILTYPLTFMGKYLKKIHKNNKKYLKNIQKCAKIYMVRIVNFVRILFKKI